MASGEDLSSMVSNRCPDGYFKLAAVNPNSTAGVALAAGVLGSGGTASQKPLAGDAWLQNMTDMVWMDSSSMSGNSAAASLTLARNEATHELNISGNATANSNTAGLIVSASGRMTEVTVSVCDALTLDPDRRRWTVQVQCSGTASGQALSSVSINGMQVCTLNADKSGYSPATSGVALHGTGMTNAFTLTLNWSATGNGSGTRMSRSEGAFKLTVQ